MTVVVANTISQFSWWLQFSPLLFLLLINTVLSVPLTWANVTTSDTYECPCNFEVSVCNDAIALHFHALPGSHTGARAETQLSLRPQTARNAVRRDAILRYHHVRIPFHGRFALTVSMSHNSRTTLCHEANIISRQTQDTCPVILPQHASEQNTVSKSLMQSERNATLRIINGVPAHVDLAKYLALIYSFRNGISSICSGSLIAPDIVITAAHCIANFSSQPKICLGSTLQCLLRAEFLQIRKIKLHPLFDINNRRTFQYDIAWIRLSKPAPKSLRTMKVNNNASIPLSWSVVRNVGYGGIGNRPQYASPLRQVDLFIPNRDRCLDSWGSTNDNKAFEIEFSRQVCVGDFKGRCGSCSGDEGGPVIQYDEENQPVLVGVKSITSDCANGKDSMDVYVRVSPYVRTFLPHKRLNETGSVQSVMVSPIPDTPIPDKPGTNKNLITGLIAGVIVALIISVILVVTIRHKLRQRKISRLAAAHPAGRAPTTGPILPDADDAQDDDNDKNPAVDSLNPEPVQPTRDTERNPKDSSVALDSDEPKITGHNMPPPTQTDGVRRT